MVDFRDVIGELRAGRVDLLFEALVKDICPFLWKRNADLLKHQGTNVSLEDFTQNCAEFVCTQVFLANLLHADAPREYLLASLNHMILRDIMGFDKRRYYRSRLLALLNEQASRYTRVRSNIYSLPHLREKALVTGMTSEIVRSLGDPRTLENTLKTKDILAFLDQVFTAAGGPLCVDDIWFLFKEHFGIRVQRFVSFEEVVDYVPFLSEVDDESIDIILRGEGSLREQDILQIVRNLYDRLADRQREALGCFALEHRRVNHGMDHGDRISWVNIQRCLNESSHQKARNRVYAGDGAVLRMLGDALSGEGFDTSDFGLALQLLANVALAGRREA